MTNQTVSLNSKRNRAVSNFLLIFLLIIRISDQFFPSIIFGQNTPVWFNEFYSFSTYILIFLLTWINKDDLKSYNIDTMSFNILLFGGIILTLQLSEELFKIILLIMTLYFYWAKSTNLIWAPENAKRQPWILPTFIFIISLGLLPLLLYSIPIKPIAPIEASTLTISFIQAYLPG